MQSTKSASIVCVDDNAEILNCLGEQLRREFGDHYDVELVSSGNAALELCTELSEENVDIPVIISDQRMPGMQGDYLLKMLHAQHPKMLTIMLTGQSDIEAVANAVNAANLYRFIPKPWDQTDLIMTVKEALRRYYQDQEVIEQKRALQQANEKLETSLSLLKATLESTADGILVVNNDGVATHWNQKLADMWGITLPKDPNHLLGMLSTQLQAPLQFNLKNEPQNQEHDNEKCSILSLVNGRLIECLSHSQSLNQEIVGCVWSFRDVTEQKQAESIIRYQASYDDLTGIANRRQFYEQLGPLIELAKLNKEHLAVLFLDLDHFKMVNDSLGHAMGDNLLRQVVNRLQNCSRDQDVVARWGGDEFTIALPNICTRQEAAAVAQRVIAALQQSFDLNGQRVCVTSSIGIAIYPDDGEDVDTLLKNADTALYLAKEQGRNNYKYYTYVSHESGQDRLTLEYDFSQALKQEEFEIYYQPQIDNQTGKISHMEALVRWQHPSSGFIPPDKFIFIAEQNGSIVALGYWVLRMACAQAKIWHDLGFQITIGVNLSPCQLRDEALFDMISDTLTKTKLDAEFLELEITESATLHNLSQVQSVLTKLNQLGIGIALDDFGTGYSSLSYLKKFPLNALKIDRFFVKDLLTQGKDIAIAKAILELGQGLNLRVVAEGVETKELQQLLQKLGCQHMQGYLFSCPLPAQAATDFLRAHYLHLDLHLADHALRDASSG